MAFGAPQIVHPFTGQDFSTNRSSVDLVIKVTDGVQFLQVNGVDVSSSVVAVSETDYDVKEDNAIPTGETLESFFIVALELVPNKTSLFDITSVSQANNSVKETVSIYITSIPSSSVGVEVLNPVEIFTDSKSESVELSWIDNNDILESPDGSGYNIYVSTSLDKRPGTYKKVNNVPVSDTSTSDQIKTVLSEISVESTTTQEFTEATVGAVKTSFSISTGLEKTRYFVIERTVLDDETGDLDALKVTLKSLALSELTSINSFLAFQHTDSSGTNVSTESESETLLTTINTALTASDYADEAEKKQYLHDAGLILKKHTKLFPLYTFKETDLVLSTDTDLDITDDNIQDAVKNANLILSVYPDLVSTYTFGVTEVVSNPHGLWTVQSDSVVAGGFSGSFYKNIKTFIADDNIGTYGDFIKSELVFTEYPLYEYRYVLTKSVDTTTKIEESDPKLKLKFLLTKDNMPEDLSFLVGEPIFFRIAFEYIDDVSQVTVESSMSPETVGVPITLSNSLVTLKHPTPTEIQNSLITSINSSLPDLDVKPGSIARSVFINPISTVHQTLHFKEYFREVSQSFTALLEFDGTDADGKSLDVSKSPNKQALRAAYGLDDTSTSNELIQDFIDNRFDLLASNFGVSRKESSFSEGKVIFSATSLSGDEDTIQISAGSLVSTNSPAVEFSVLNTLTKNDFTSFRNGDGFYTANVNIRAVISGVSGNIPANSITVAKGGSNTGLSVTNPASTFGGKDKANNRELVEKVEARQLSSDTGTIPGLTRAISETGLAQKFKVVESGDPFLKRGFDYVARKDLAGYVDVYIKGKFPRNYTETFGVFYEKKIGSLVNFKINSLGDDPYDFGTPFAEIDFLVDNPGLDNDYIDIYEITRAEITSPPGNTFSKSTNLILESVGTIPVFMKSGDFKVALDLGLSEKTVSGSVTTSIVDGNIHYDLGDAVDYSKYKNKAISISGFDSTDNNVDPLDNLKGRPLSISDAGSQYLEVDVAGLEKTVSVSGEDLSSQIDSTDSVYQEAVVGEDLSGQISEGVTLFSLEFPNVVDSTNQVTTDIQDVTVRLNGEEISTFSLNGGVGNIVLDGEPSAGDSLSIDYSYRIFKTEFTRIVDGSDVITDDTQFLTAVVNAVGVTPIWLDGSEGKFALQTLPVTNETFTVSYSYTREETVQAIISLGQTNIVSPEKVINAVVAATIPSTGKLRFTTTDSVDYSSYTGKFIQSTGFEHSVINIGALLTVDPVFIKDSGVGYIEITDPGSGSVETKTATIKISGNLDLYLFDEESAISFDLLMRRDFLHRVLKKPLDTVTSLVDSNNIVYKENLNYVQFNNSKVLILAL